MIIPLETVDHATFVPHIGGAFITTAAGASVELRLIEARKLGHRRVDANREPFALVFGGPQGLRLPQGIYRFSCAPLGELEFFITQVADGPQGAQFEAVFT